MSVIGRVHYWTVHSPHILIAVWNSSNQGDQMNPRASDRPLIMRQGTRSWRHISIRKSFLSVRAGLVREGTAMVR